GQGHPTDNPRCCVAEGRAEQRGGGRGWPEHGTVFAAQAERYLRELHDDLKDGSYRPNPVKRVEIPKGDGRTRPLWIPTVKDRIVQTALKLTIEPIFEVQFRPGSYGFRPGRSCKDALREVDRLLKEGYTHVVDADLQGYFDSIPHDRLMALVAGSISDGRVLSLIEGFLQQDIMTDMARWQPTTGTPQGAVISPLLANLYLHPLDLLMEQSGWRMVRYADDFVVLCRTEVEARDALRQVEAWVAENGLTLHPDKTRVGDSRQSGQGFEFLGYRFEAGRRLVRKKSLKALQDKVRARTVRSRGDSLERIIGDLNPMLRGWFGYFKHATPALYGVLDGFVRRRLRAILRKQERRPGIGRCEADHRRWPNAFFAAHGLFTLRTAFEQARHSR
ncbi:MAG: group II intron reverse transcriptase/maturase, partial [Pseudolabrys sp.]